MSPVSRRNVLRTLAASAAGMSASGWLPTLAQRAAAAPARKRSCILLWMAGGPSQTDTFDMKPHHENGGEFQEIATATPGMRFSEHLPGLAKVADKLALVRGVSTREGDHGRGTFLMRTGQKPMSPIKYPPIGASLASQLDSTEGTSGMAQTGLPPYVSIGAFRAANSDAFGAGFLGPQFGPLFVGATDTLGRNTPDSAGFPELKVDSLDQAGDVTDDRQRRRLKLWRGFQDPFLARHPSGAPQTQDAV